MSALAASPTMVGAVTVLIAVVAVFLAYNANQGLPFVPNYRISADLPNANTLVPGNEVRVGGVRVGVVESIRPIAENDGTAIARLDLKLDPDVDPLPVDTQMIVRSRSALGLKYLELRPGTSTESFQEGAVIPLASATPEPVEIDEFLSTFDARTRVAIQANLVEFGNALAGRGVQLNAALGRLPGVLEYLEPVMANLGSPRTRLDRFVRAIAATAAEVAPVAEVQAQLFVDLDTTFTAFAEVARPYIQETISESPPTLDAGTRAFPVIRPFLANSATLFTDLRPGVNALAAAAPDLADALETGTPVLRESDQLNDQLAPTAASLVAFNDDAGVRSGIDRLQQTVEIFGPFATFVAPAQTVCNYGGLLFRNVASLLQQKGTWAAQRFTVFDPPDGVNNEGSPSSGPANGGGSGANTAGNFLHYNPYPNTASPGQPKECEAGNEPYKVGQQVIGNAPGNQGTITDDQPGISDAAADEAAAEAEAEEAGG